MRVAMMNAAMVVGLMFASDLGYAAPEGVYKDWRVACETSDGHHTCQMLQTLPASEGSADVFLLSIGKPEGAENAMAVVSVPLGVYLAPGVEIHVSGKRPFKVLYEICDQTSCHAGFQLNGSVLQSFKRGTSARFRVWTEATKAVEFPVSLLGFTAALSELNDRVAQ